MKMISAVFHREKSGKIELEAITNGPYDTISKYKKLGFKEIYSIYK